MKKKILTILLALFVLLSGCGKQPENSNAWKDPVLVAFDVFAVNDLHGKLADTDQQPGVDELSTYLKQARESGNVILLSTGDMWQGASESNLTNGLIVTDWMNELDFTAMTVGGHEFDWGEDKIRENLAAAEFPFLAINVYNRETNTRVEYCQSSVVVEIEGAQIGIIGAIGDCYYSISSANTQDIYFKTGNELTALVKEESAKLRREGVDFIIYTIHDGYDQNYAGSGVMEVKNRDLKAYYDGVLSNGYVDLVFEADTHYSYVLRDEFGVYHLQCGGNNQGVSHAKVILDIANGEVMVPTAELLDAGKYSYLEDDPVVEDLFEKYADAIAPATRFLGNNGQYRNRDAICQLVAKLYCEKGVEKWGAEYDIVLGGGYISCRSPGYLPAGEVLYSHLQALLPFDNQIMLCSIKGRDLVNKFLETDNEAYYIQTTAYGEEIRDHIDPNETYYVITDSYSAEYTYNRMTVIDTYDETTFARDLVAEYITGGGLG